MLLRPGLPELRVYSFDKHFLCPGGGWCAVSAVVVKGWLRSQDFLERLALRDQIGNPVSDNRDHLAVLDYIGLIADPSLTGNDVRAAFLLVLRNTQFDDLIESRQNTLQTAAVLPVDDGVGNRREQVAGGDDVGPAEEYQAVAIGVGCGDMDDLDTLSVEKPVFIRRKSFCRPCVKWRWGLTACRRTHFFEYVLMCDDGRRFRQTAGKQIRELHRDRIAGFANRHVSASVIRMEMRIDDVSNRFVRDAPDRGDQLCAEFRVLRIDDYHRMFVDLYRGVAARSNQHIHVSLDRQRGDFHLVEVRRLRPRCWRGTDESRIGRLSGRRVGIPELRQEIRIHRLRPPWKGNRRNSVANIAIQKKRILPGEVVRNVAFLAV